MHLHLVKKIISVTFCLFILSTVSAAAENTTDDNTLEPANLFINSNPINASILVDDIPVLQKTPALIRNLSSGIHKIGIRKSGFAPVDFEITLGSGSTDVYKTELTDGIVIADFPDRENIFLRTFTDAALSSSLNISEGSYNISIENNDIYISPVYPKEQLLAVTGTLFFTALAANIVSAAVELNTYGELFLPHSNYLILTETATAILGLTEIALLYDRSDYIKNFELYNADLTKLDSEAEKIFNRAQTSLSKGRLEDALTEFSDLISNYPDYSAFPEALYKVARLHIFSGDTNLAMSELRIIIENYPDAGIYDKACQTLALLYFNLEEPENSRKAVEKMVFFDPLFSGTADEISNIGIDRVIENWARNPERQVD